MTNEANFTIVVTKGRSSKLEIVGKFASLEACTAHIGVMEKNGSMAGVMELCAVVGQAVYLSDTYVPGVWGWERVRRAKAVRLVNAADLRSKLNQTKEN